jgi:hypothetical protein
MCTTSPKAHGTAPYLPPNLTATVDCPVIPGYEFYPGVGKRPLGHRRRRSLLEDNEGGLDTALFECSRENAENSCSCHGVTVLYVDLFGEVTERCVQVGSYVAM